MRTILRKIKNTLNWSQVFGLIVLPILAWVGIILGLKAIL